MFTEFEEAVIRNYRLDADLIESIDPALVITFKDGTKHQLVESYSRVMGYWRPMSEYNIGKRQEHEDRQLFEEPKEIA